MQSGLIVKSNAGFYNVYIPETKRQISAKAKGTLRHQNIKPLVGDRVIVSGEEPYIILQIEKRTNELVRPQVANMEYGIIIISAVEPTFQAFLLDKYLVTLESNDIQPIIVVTKCDLLTEAERLQLMTQVTYYKAIGYPVFIAEKTSFTERDQFCALLHGRIATVLGQTGAGKTTFLNSLTDNRWKLATDEISQALGRGKHTTRLVELYDLETFWLADTPGFSSFAIHEVSPNNLTNCFVEFQQFPCKFNNCQHINERICGVIAAVQSGKISNQRYENYCKIRAELAQ